MNGALKKAATGKNFWRIQIPRQNIKKNNNNNKIK